MSILQKAIFLILILFSATFLSIPQSYGMVPTLDDHVDSPEIFSESKQESIRNHILKLNESIGIQHEKDQEYDSSSSQIDYEQIKLLNLILHEKISVDSVSPFGQITSVKSFDELKAMMEKIFGKSKSKSKSLLTSILDTNIDYNDKNFNESTENINLPSEVFTTFDPKTMFNVLKLENYFLPEENYEESFHSQEEINLFEQNSAIILVSLAPLAFAILISPNTNSKSYQKINRGISYSMVVLLVSSAIITPLAISNNYWPEAYAEESSFAGIIEDSSYVISVINATITEPVINATTTDLIVNATNATATEILETNATTTDLIVNATNATATETEIIIPNATVSFQFDEPILESNVTTTEPILESNTTSQELTSLELDGKDDFIQIQNVTVTDDVDGLTVTAWVKPDYSSGSAEFTVLSKDKSFSLTITNNFLSENTAKFSVFDGIKWTTVESTSVITEDWSFLSSTFDGEYIGIFVNGTREGTQEVAGVPTLTTNGKLDTTTVENLTSEEDIVIGATVTTKDEQTKASNQFSGEIDDVSLYDYVLDDEQILAMYEQTKDVYAIIVPELTLEEIIAQIEEEQELIATSNQTTTANNTSTQIIEEPLVEEVIVVDTEILSTELEEDIDKQESEIQVTPEILSLDDNYELSDDVTFDLEFYDEYDALMLEISEIELATELLLAETEQNLIELEDAPITENETNPVLGFLFGLQRFIPLQTADAAQADEIDELRIALTDAKQRLEQLKITASELKTQTPDEQTVKDLKTELKETVKEIKTIINKLQKANFSSQATDLQNITNSAENIGDVKSAEKQNGKWSDDKIELVTDVYDVNGNKVNLDVAYEKLRDGKFNVKVSPDSNTKPGLYKIVSTFTVDGVEHTIESEFAWGVLTINTDKSIYLPNEESFISMAVLDDEGSMVCDADVSLKIADPYGLVTILSTANGQISVSEECEYLGVTNMPDYYTYYTVGETGTYSLELTAITDNGIKDISDSIIVQDYVPFDVIRDGPTRIYPLVPYTMTIPITTNENYSGMITETVPASFEITPQDGLHVKTIGEIKELSWNVNLKQDDSITLFYEFDAPDVSPELFLLGPLQIGSFSETRQWQIASDAVTIGTTNTVSVVNTATTNAITWTAGGTDTLAIIQVTDIAGVGLTGTPFTDSNNTWVLAASQTTTAPYVYMYYALSPTSSTTTVNYNAAATSAVNVITFTGTDTSSPIGATSSNTGTNTTPTDSVVTSFDNSMVLSLIGTDWNHAITENTATSDPTTITENWEFTHASGGIKHQASSYTQLDGVASTVTIDTTGAKNKQAWSVLMIEIKEPAGTAYTETPTETVAVTDTLAKTITKNLTEEIAVSDGTVSVTTQFSTDRTETVGITDTLSKRLTKNLTETIAVSDGTVATSLTITQNLTEEIAVDDGTVATAQSIGSNRTATVGITDTLAKTITKNLTEEIAVDDGTVATSLTITQNLTEEIAVSDGTVA
ncbi:Concanavalin A-like lectin/glucanase protein, partial [Marine Group I thaumarchaeote SCGC AAA799-P11]